jgi:GT2 family glycosyltransferase
MHTSRHSAGERVTTDRPTIDVVVPFKGPAESLVGLVDRLGRLTLREGDTITIADNRPEGVVPVEGSAGVHVLPVPERQSSYHARNRGAALGAADWLLFLDGDVEPTEDLLDRYFPEPAAPGTAVLVGAVEDDQAGDGSTPVARFTRLQRSMGQQNTLGLTGWAFAQTANCAIRRGAFEQVGGFDGTVRSAGDADICFRLRDAGWGMERRDGAAVVHRNRTSLRDLLRQRARHGAGVEWLARRYPGAFPRKRWLGLAKWAAGSMARAVVDAARGRRDDALVHAIEPLSVWAFNLGRLLPNRVDRTS